MELFHTRYSGQTIDNATKKQLSTIPLTSGWIKLPSTDVNPFDLSTLIEPGNYIIDYTKNHHTYLNNTRPMNVSVYILDNMVYQLVIYPGNQSDEGTIDLVKPPCFMIRHGSGQYGNIFTNDQGWKLYQFSDKIYLENEIQNYNLNELPENALVLKELTNKAPQFLINLQGRLINILPKGLLMKDIYDAHNQKSDIYAYIDAQLAGINMGTISTALDTHIKNTHIHPNRSTKDTWQNNATKTSLTTKMNTLETQLRNKVNSSINTNVTLLGNLGTEMTNFITNTMNTHKSNATLHVTPAQITKFNNAAPKSHTHKSDRRVNIDGNKIVSGILNSARIPKGAAERLVEVNTDAQRFALTINDVQNGDSVKVIDTGKKFYFVVDDTKLNVEAGYQIYATSPGELGQWPNIINKPTTVAGYGITDLNTKTEFNNIDTQLDTTLKNNIEVRNAAFDVRSMESDLVIKIPGYIISSVTYGNGLYVAVGYNGTILTSTDGITWTTRTSGTTNSLWSITYGNGLYVAVGSGGTILTSTDVITWTSRTSITTNDLTSITYANGLYVAVGFDRNGGIIFTSTDAITWTSRTIDTTDNLTSITYANGLYVAVGFDRNGGTVLTSTDAITWTSRTSGTTNALYGITYGNGLYVAVGSGGTILTSTDGITWTIRTSGTTYNLYSIAYGNGLYITVGMNNSYVGIILTSTDAITWSKSKMITGFLYFIGSFISFINNHFITTGEEIIHFISNSLNNSLKAEYNDTNQLLFIYDEISYSRDPGRTHRAEVTMIENVDNVKFIEPKVTASDNSLTSINMKLLTSLATANEIKTLI